MSASAIETKIPKPLTQEEVIVLASRARQDDAAFDEMMSALVVHADRARKSERRVESLERQVSHLEHRLALILLRMFGRSSEKIDPAQLRLFLEEAAAVTTPPEPETPTETVTFKRRPKGHGRDKFPPHLKREDIHLDPDAAERKCAACGNDFCRIREEVTERGHFVPGYWEVKRYIRGVWACKNGCGSVVTAALPPALVEKSKFEPSVAVHTAVSKFGDHLPLERQAAMHARLGVEIAPTTLGDGVAALGALHQPTVVQMETEVLADKHIQVDDTPFVAIIDAPPAEKPSNTASESTPETGKSSKKKLRILARIWVYVSLCGKVFYRFTEDRKRDCVGGPAEVLSKFCGCLIGDEYAGYAKICSRPGMKQAACWAHCRRKFKDALIEDKKRSSRIMAMIGRLFWIEAAVSKRREAGKKVFTSEDHLKLREHRSKLQVEKIVAYAEAIKNDVIPRGLLGTAIGYLIGNIEHLKTFLEDPLVPIDNNAAERALRAVAVGRKNYLFFGSLASGDTAAVLYSLIGSCKALGINPHAYLIETTRTLLANPDTPRAEVTPWAWAAAKAAALRSEPPTPPPASTTP